MADVVTTLTTNLAIAAAIGLAVTATLSLAVVAAIGMGGYCSGRPDDCCGGFCFKSSSDP